YSNLLREAVRQRVCGRTASHLSGGMDSTSVALIARDWIDSGVGEPPLHALTLVYARLPSLAREQPYVEIALGQRGIQPHCIEADDLLAFDEYAEPPVHDEPCAELHHFGRQRVLLEAGLRAGVGTVLTGEGADDFLDIPPYYLADLVRRGHLRTAWSR